MLRNELRVLEPRNSYLHTRLVRTEKSVRIFSYSTLTSDLVWSQERHGGMDIQRNKQLQVLANRLITVKIGKEFMQTLACVQHMFFGLGKLKSELPCCNNRVVCLRPSDQASTRAVRLARLRQGCTWRPKDRVLHFLCDRLRIFTVPRILVQPMQVRHMKEGPALFQSDAMRHFA